MQVIYDAAEAIGGMRTVERTETVVIEGHGTTFNLGQNRNPDASLPEIRDLRVHTRDRLRERPLAP